MTENFEAKNGKLKNLKLEQLLSFRIYFTLLTPFHLKSSFLKNENQKQILEILNNFQK